MKFNITYLLFSAFVGSFFFQCRSNKEQEPSPQPERVDFDKGAVQIMDTLVSQLQGRWNMQELEIDVKYSVPMGSVKKDTVFTDFAVFEIIRISRSEDLRYPVCQGKIKYLNYTYQVGFRLGASAERIVHKTGPQAFTLLDWQFESGFHQWKNEELFFRDLGLVSENYAVELKPDGTMIWSGLNRDVKTIRVKKI